LGIDTWSSGTTVVVFLIRQLDHLLNVNFPIIDASMRFLEMNFMHELLGWTQNKNEVNSMNRGIVTALTSIGIAQLLKVPIKGVTKGEWSLETLIETGGMPSSHSAGVSSLATYVALKKGVPTIDFALATVFGLIVMYDAQGIRRQTGELSIKVNDLDEEIELLEGKHNELTHEEKEQRLKEMLGHQPEEVVGGALLGMALGAMSFALEKE
jgi:acid phosphatase family membrane protein YuiD